MRLTFHGTLLGIILLLLALMAVGPARQLYDEHQQVANDERTLAAGNAEAARLTARLQALRDPNYLELVARQELGYVRPGEVSYLIVHPQQPPPVPPKAKPHPKSWLSRNWAPIARLWPW